MVKSVSYDVQFYTAETDDPGTAAMQIGVGTLTGPDGFGSEIVADTYAWMEYPKSKWRKTRIMERNTSAGVNASTPYSKQRIKGVANIREMFKAFGNIRYGSSTHYTWPVDYQGALNTNPAAEIPLYLIAQTLGGASGSAGANTLPNIWASVKLVYDVEFSNPVFPGNS